MRNSCSSQWNQTRFECTNIFYLYLYVGIEGQKHNDRNTHTWMLNVKYSMFRCLRGIANPICTYSKTENNARQNRVYFLSGMLYQTTRGCTKKLARSCFVNYILATTGTSNSARCAPIIYNHGPCYGVFICIWSYNNVDHNCIPNR